MELLGERPVWSMSGVEMLTTLDAVKAEVARLQTYGLHIVAGIENTGYAEEIGAHDTARLLTFRYRLDSVEAHRDVRLARALPKYATVSAALPDTTSATSAADLSTTHPDDIDPIGDPDVDGTAAARATADGATADGASADGASADGASADGRTADGGAADGGAADGGAADGGADDGGADDGGAGEAAGGVGERPLHPAQAQAIVWALDRVAARVPLEHLAVAEEQLVGLASHLSPGQLRRAGKEIGDLLDSDGPGPDEDKAYLRESLTLANAENGVKFRGFLANENAELLRALTHAGARPHKTIDGELDPRPRDKRQADALTSALTIAAAATDTGYTPPPNTRPAPGDTPPANARPATPTATPTATATGAAAQAAAETGPIESGPTETGPTETGPTETGPTETGDAATTDPARAATSTDNARAGGSDSAAGGWVPGFGAKANITVTIDFNDLKAATADATGQLVYGDALSAAAIRRLACDAKIIPLVLGSNSEPLDVGRSERLVNRAMRRALNARDKGCVVCGAPPIHCDAHHVRSWIDGGPTAISNLVLLCRRHHIDLHAGHWTITITNGTVQVSRPTWADPPPRPNTRHPAQQQSPAHNRVGAPPPNSTAARSDAHGAPVSPPDTARPSGAATWLGVNSAARHSPPTSPHAASEAPAAMDGVVLTGGASEGGALDGRALDGEVSGRGRGDNSDGPSSGDATRLDCWGEEESSASAQTSRSVNRWPDDETRREAARFAVWGDTSAGDAAADSHGVDGAGLDPRGDSPFDPWGGAALADEAVLPPATAGLHPGPSG
ncbi:HNH endonuclease [Kribbella steppae]|uniref:HNH endonuclease n=1 Tax=Kribbella steppae TaxID=2512223 RepID=A0A4R2HTU9_9ACTN|nr:HNH endonuclease signature motif containing protein [Kribbella steppae]TCO33435.1 HNH endonuclease [Kribbella steppae]